MNFNSPTSFNWGQTPQLNSNGFSGYGYNIQNTQSPPYSIKWAEGKESAKSFELPPNSQVILLDSKNDDRMYIRTTDSLGRYNTMFFKITQVSEEELDRDSKEKIDLSMFVTRDEFENFVQKISGGLNEQPVSNESAVQSAKPLTTISTLSKK